LETLLTNFPKNKKNTKEVLSNLSKHLKIQKVYDKITKNMKNLEHVHLNFPKKRKFFGNGPSNVPKN